MTNGIRIPISADLAGVEQAVADLQRKTKDAVGNIQGKASIDTSSAKKSLQEVLQSAKAVQDAIKGASAADLPDSAVNELSASFNAAAKGANALQSAMGGMGKSGGSSELKKTLAETRGLITSLQEAKRLQAALAQHGYHIPAKRAPIIEADFKAYVASTSGARRKRLEKFGNLATLANNKHDLAGNELASHREFLSIMQEMGLSKPGSPNPTPGPGEKKPNTFRSFVLDSLKRAGTGIARVSMPAGSGIAQSIAGNAATEAAATPGGMLSGAGAMRLLAGGGVAMAAFGAVRAATSVHQQMRSTEDEEGTYSDMLRGMGGTTSSFDDLRSAVRATSESLMMAFGSGSQLASHYQRAAGIDGLGRHLGQEVQSAGGFARSMGLDPEAGVSLFSTLRRTKATGSDAENKRVALLIGEGIARAGVFTKADDVMSSVASLVTTAAQGSLAAPNVDAMVGGMDNLMRMGVPGLDPAGAGALLGRADQALRNPGSEAARNLLLGTMQKRMPDFNAMDLGFMLDGGAFGTAEQAFGDKSVAAMAAKANGDSRLQAKYRKLAAVGGNGTTLDAVMQQLSGSNTDSMRENIMGMFQFSSSEASAMLTAYKRNGSITDAYSNIQSKYKLDPAKMNGGSIRSLLDIEYGSGTNLSDKAKFLRTQNLSDVEKDRLKAAEDTPGEDNANLKKTLMQLSASRPMELNPGDISRRNLSTLENLTSTVASQLIPIANTIREAVVAIANKMGANIQDKYGNSDKKMTALRDALASTSDDDQRAGVISKFRDEAQGDKGAYTKDYLDNIDSMYKEISQVAGPAPGQGGNLASGQYYKSDRKLAAMAAKVRAPSKYDDVFKKEAARVGMDWLMLKQWAVQESDLNPDAINVNSNGSKDRGLMQLNDRFDTERGLKKWDDPVDNIRVGANSLASAFRRGGANFFQGAKNYNGTGPDADAYAQNAQRLRLMIAGNRTAGADIWAPSRSKAAQHTASGGPAVPPAKTASTAPNGGAIAPAPFGMMPAPQSAFGASSNGGVTKLHLTGEFRNVDRQGNPVAAPILIDRVTAPVPAGVGGR